MAAGRKYSDEEVRAILDRALSRDTRRDVTHEELVAIASEVGISRDAIDAAAEEVEGRRELDAARARIVDGRRRAWLSHATTYALVNAFLFAVNFLTTPGEWWVLFPVLGWGLGLLLHAGGAFSRRVSDDAVTREVRRAERRRARIAPTDARVRVADEPRQAEDAGVESEASWRAEQRRG